jgi:hypothetical protein
MQWVGGLKINTLHVVIVEFRPAGNTCFSGSGVSAWELKKVVGAHCERGGAPSKLDVTGMRARAVFSSAPASEALIKSVHNSKCMVGRVPMQAEAHLETSGSQAQSSAKVAEAAQFFSDEAARNNTVLVRGLPCLWFDVTSGGTDEGVVSLGPPKKLKAAFEHFGPVR